MGISGSIRLGAVPVSISVCTRHQIKHSSNSSERRGHAGVHGMVLARPRPIVERDSPSLSYQGTTHGSQDGASSSGVEPGKSDSAGASAAYPVIVL
jgi:hypothetical protein